jgi:hypothetical protein
MTKYLTLTLAISVLAFSLLACITVDGDGDDSCDTTNTPVPTSTDGRAEWFDDVSRRLRVTSNVTPLPITPTPEG